MSPAHVFEPTYDAIKRRLMTGEWAAGTRIEAGKLAEELGVSLTPVRDSLYRLNGEQLVDFMPGEGFHAHRPSETELRDMLELHLILLLAALATAPRRRAETVSADEGHPDRASALFLAIARRSANSEIIGTITSLGNRLHLSRHFDEAVLGGVADELQSLETALSDAAPQAEVRNLLLVYHERRAHEAATYARLISGHPGRTQF